MVRIDVFGEGIRLPYKSISRQKIKMIAFSASDMLVLQNASISIIATNDAFIRKMNREFRGLDEPTDVISFSNRDNPFPETGLEQEEIGDIYISLERAERQSHEFHVSLKDEVKRLIVHGILHLIGYDHERSDEDETIMLAKQDELCDAIDV